MAKFIKVLGYLLLAFAMWVIVANSIGIYLQDIPMPIGFWTLIIPIPAMPLAPGALLVWRGNWLTARQPPTSGG